MKFKTFFWAILEDNRYLVENYASIMIFMVNMNKIALIREK